MAVMFVWAEAKVASSAVKAAALNENDRLENRMLNMSRTLRWVQEPQVQAVTFIFAAPYCTQAAIRY